MDQQEILKNYINRILELQDASQESVPLSAEELKKVAIELGLDEDAWEELQQEFQDHKERGAGFMRYENWLDAIAEYEYALTLNPIDPQSLEALARCHFQRWKQTGRPNERDEAISYARRMLNIEPGHEASLRLISETRNEESSFSSEKKAPPSPPVSNTVAILAAIMLVVLGAGILVYLQVSGMDSMEAQNTTDPVIPPAAADEQKGATTPLNPTLSLAVELKESSLSEGFQLMPLASSIDEYTDAFSYKAHGYMEVQQTELERLLLRIDLLDASDQRVASKEFTLVQEHKAIGRPGDILPWKVLIHQKVKPERPIKKAVYSYVKVNKNPSQPAYPESEKLGNPVWDIKRPSGHELEVRERKFTISQPQTVRRAYAKIQLEVENKGLASYRRLKLALVWKGGGKSKTSEFYMLAEEFPFLIPGRTAIGGGTFQIDPEIAEAFSGYEVHVIEWN